MSSHQWLMVTVHHGLWMPRVDDCSFPEQRNKDRARIALGLSLGTICHSVCGWQVIDLCLHNGFSLLATTTCNQWLWPAPGPLPLTLPLPHSCSIASEMDTAFVSFTSSTTILFREQPGADAPLCLRGSSEGGCLLSP